MIFSITTTVVAVLLVALSAFFLVTHFRSWQRTRQAGVGEAEHDFARRQFRRRFQTSLLIGLIGVAMFVGQFVPHRWLGIHWLAILLLVLWVMLLALGDALASHQHFGRLRRANLAEQVKLQAEIRRKGQTNGHVE